MIDAMSIFSKKNNDESHGEQCRDRSGNWWSKPNPMGWGSNDSRIVTTGGNAGHDRNESGPSMHGSRSEWHLTGKHGGAMNYGNTDKPERIKQSGEKPGRGKSGPGRK
jgi:hypothetical protein